MTTISLEELIAEIKAAPSSFAAKQLRPFGLCAGEFVVPDDFDVPLPEDILPKHSDL